MPQSETEALSQPPPEGAVGVYCLGTLVAEEAQKGGHDGFARSIELALNSFLDTLPRDLQSQALRLAYELSLGRESPAAPRLRLVYSRD